MYFHLVNKVICFIVNFNRWFVINCKISSLICCNYLSSTDRIWKFSPNPMTVWNSIGGIPCNGSILCNLGAIFQLWRCRSADSQLEETITRLENFPLSRTRKQSRERQFSPLFSCDISAEHRKMDSHHRNIFRILASLGLRRSSNGRGSHGCFSRGKLVLNRFAALRPSTRNGIQLKNDPCDI